MKSVAQARASVLGAAMLWGTTGTAAALAPSLSAITVGAAAMGLDGILQGIVNGANVRRSTLALGRHAWVVAVGVMCVALYPLAFYSSMRVGGVAVGSVVSLASAPLASAIIERIVDGRKLTQRWMLASGLGILGGTLLSAAHPGTVGAAHSSAPGIFLGLLAGCTYAGYSWALRRLMRNDVTRGAATGAVLGLGGILLLPLVVVNGSAIAGSLTTWLVVAYLAVVPMFLGYVLFGIGLGALDATTATTITLIEPAVATVLAVVVLAERTSAAGWTGIALICGALCLLTVSRRHSAATPTPHPSGGAVLDPAPGTPPVSTDRTDPVTT
ncbi:DMT family transporter [Gordonia rhizosphera]|uniref:EamA domain-containing protein n=1 Tax=Gordonia rhizosphera NBRC 16068 TaxID=1108045 RepID=K6V438_9ACTN|nr:DMT family transporter [Gordonia rhizosphera]GAB90858.1 hypothetical protein GORHZ_118_00750 [Gordonia rhizosphera NBRC 16068]